MTAQCTVYWEKVEHPDGPNTMGTVLKGQYILKSSWSLNGWESEKEFIRERASHDKKFQGKKTVDLDNGSSVTGLYFDYGRGWGIHMFEVISFEEAH